MLIPFSNWTLLQPEEIERVHNNSVALLERVGMTVMDGELRDRLRRAGGRVDGDRVRLPAQMVAEALALVPRDIRFYDTRGDWFTAGRGSRLLGCTGDALSVFDFADNTVRAPTLDDVAAFARLADALPEIKVTRGVPVVPKKPEGLAGQLKATETLLLNSSKHHFTSPLAVEMAEVWIDLGEIVNEGVALAERPIFSALITPVSPLQFGVEGELKMKLMARKRVPIMLTSCPMAGATGPFTLAGTLAQQNAENLFLLVAVQVMQPGSPVFLGPVSAILDMATGSQTYASPEFLLFHLANIELAAYYGLPSYHPLAHTDATELDYQAGLERGISAFMLYSAGAAVIGGAGSYHKTNICSLEQLLIDVEMYRVIAHFFRGFPLDEDSLALDEIERVGPGGNYLIEERTLRYMRSGMHFLSNVFNRQMLGPQAHTVLEKAHTQVTRILRQHDLIVPPQIADEVKRYVRERAKTFPTFSNYG